MKKRVQHKVRDEENQIERAIVGDVKKWLDDADDVIFDYEDFLEDEGRPYAVYSDGYLPKPFIRYLLSKMLNKVSSK